jgi:membrane-bound metal-dependent hydrolase YbcI (DUF457 family)
MIAERLSAAFFHLADTLPWFWLRGVGHRGVTHPLLSLLVLVLIFALVAWNFRSKPSRR